MSQELREEARRREQERICLEQKNQEFARDVQCVASRPEGKRFLRRLLEDGDIFNPAWIPGAAGAYQAGRRAQALGLWRILREHLPGGACLGLVLPDSGETGPAPDEAWQPEAWTPEEPS